MTAINRFGITCILACILLALLGLVGPMFGKIAKEVLPELNLNQHALDRHGELAVKAKLALDECPPADIVHLDGKDDFAGYEIFTCPMKDTRNPQLIRWAVLVCTTQNDCVRTVTAFSARTYQYMTNLIAQGKYVIEK